MSCSVGPNSTVISLLCSTHGAPVLLGRSIFHGEKEQAAKNTPSPKPAVVAKWLRAQRRKAERSDGMNKSRRTRLLAGIDSLIQRVEAEEEPIDGKTFSAWKALAVKLEAPQDDEGALPPITAHRIREEGLLRLLPETRPEDLTQVRQGFARYITYHAQREGFSTWQEAWNGYTGATPDTPGTVRYRPHQCVDCGGFGYTTKENSLSTNGRSYGGSMMTNYCPTCRGTGRPRTTIEAPAAWVDAPPAN